MKILFIWLIYVCIGNFERRCFSIWFMCFFCMRIVYKCSCVSVWAEAIWGFFLRIGIDNGQVYVVLMEWLTFR